MTLEPIKHEKVARIGRISNVFRIAGAQSAEQSVGIRGEKYLLTPTSYEYIEQNHFLKGKKRKGYIWELKKLQGELPETLNI
jgi:hypothetical protein